MPSGDRGIVGTEAEALAPLHERDPVLAEVVAIVRRLEPAEAELIVRSAECLAGMLTNGQRDQLIADFRRGNLGRAFEEIVAPLRKARTVEAA